MAEDISIDQNLSDEEKYKQLIVYAEGLINNEEPRITSLANICALLKQTFDKINWVGFYFASEGSLYLGPFQGKVACSVIPLGNGVCGDCALKKETIIVKDVDKYPGHIICDEESKSEIVLPVLLNNKLFAVLDLDSYKYSAFNEIDKKYLEQLIELIKQKTDLNFYILS